ncbi:MAG TPA: substrate-binding domain-containing protein [Anaeromyxobacteraceae bacterium]|nr:substrate-binding domain-containing protein [Anaeromyxobacteraceae bacterium]
MRVGSALLWAVVLCATSARAKDTLGFSIASLSNPFPAAVLEGARAAADKLGVELVVVDAEEKTEKQTIDLEDLLKSQARAVLLYAVDPKQVAPSVEKANLAEVPVITIERAVSGAKVACHVASDDAAGGRLVGEYLCRLLGGRGEVAELQGSAGSAVARRRGQGFGSALRNCHGVRLAAIETAHSDRAEALTVTENLLQAHPAVGAVFAQDDEMALGALHASRAGNHPVHIVGYGATVDAVKAVEACELAATVDPQPALMGRLAVEKAVALVKMKRLPEKTVSVEVALKLVTSSDCK